MDSRICTYYITVIKATKRVVEKKEKNSSYLVRADFRYTGLRLLGYYQRWSVQWNISLSFARLLRGATLSERGVISDVTPIHRQIRLLAKPNPLVLTSENGASTLHYPRVLEPHTERGNREMEVLTLKIVDPMDSLVHCPFLRRMRTGQRYTWSFFVNCLSDVWNCGKVTERESDEDRDQGGVQLLNHCRVPPT